MISKFPLQIARCKTLLQLNSLTEVIENEDFFQIAFEKEKIFRQKKDLFKSSPPSKIVVITNATNLGNVSNEIHATKINTLEEERLCTGAFVSSEVRSLLENSIVILTNNNLARIRPDRLAEVIEGCPSSIFALHDFDNHHWYEMSLQAAAICDVYIPAHLDSYAIVGRINSNTIHNIPCGSIQWTKSFIETHGELLTKNVRRQEPLGIHSYYPKFVFRNRVLKTVNEHFSTVGLLPGDFHGRTAEDRWNEWTSFQLHWIAPVHNDLPLRFFDALVTGGIPLVPASLRVYLEILCIPRDFYILYNAVDLLDVREFVDRANNAFMEAGSEGVMERHSFALEKFHVDSGVMKIVEKSRYMYGIGNPP
jgi:hypothetical protein